MKRLHVINYGLLLFMIAAFNISYSFTTESNTILNTMEKYKGMDAQQLFNMGNKFSENNVRDSAFIFYSLIYNSKFPDIDTSSWQIVCKALNRASKIYYHYYNYALSLELLLRAIDICKKIGYNKYIGRIYNNVGNIYYQFEDHKSANRYYKLAYKHSCENYLSSAVLNNLGILADEENNMDSALLLYKQAYMNMSSIKDSIYDVAINNIGSAYHSCKHYDSAFYYYKLGLNNARKFSNHAGEALILSNIGQLYFELSRFDSAVYYFNKSNLIAKRFNIFKVMSNNYLYLSKTLESRGDLNGAFELYKKYSAINDTIFNAYKHVAINELQFMYNMSAMDKQMKELSIDQEINKRTISIQRQSQVIMGLILLIVIAFLILFYLKNKTLNKAYNALVIKNIEIVGFDNLKDELSKEYEERLRENELIISKLRTINDIQDEFEQVDNGLLYNTSNEVNMPNHQSSIAKYKHSSLKNEYRDELATEILKIMKNKEVFCDVDFSVDKLSDMINSNPTYVSQIINDSFKKNFRTFINDYRIKEARKILSSPECRKYTIESIGFMVGFKSRRTFDVTFKETTGISPAFYVKSQKK